MKFIATLEEAIPILSISECLECRLVKFFLYTFYVVCLLYSILCLDLVFGVFSIQYFGFLVPQFDTAPIVLTMSFVLKYTK